MNLKKIVKKDSSTYYLLKKLKTTYLYNKLNKMNEIQKMEYIGKLYKKKIGRDMNWSNPKSYTEKIQYEKLNGRMKEKVQLADKYRVRKWVKEKIGEDYLIGLLGVWEKAREIDFQSLPNRFVLKTNCSSGDVVIVKDKSTLSSKDIRNIRKKLDFYLHCKYGVDTGEFQYELMKPVIIAEEFIEYQSNDLPDYKFLCFDGVPMYCWVDIGRYSNHKRNVYNLKWELQSWNQEKYGNTNYPIEAPKNFDKMIEIATQLSNGFPHVRVDLYNVNGKIYFGEMTFTNGSGFEPIIPSEADEMLGELWSLSK